jgi:hypothetical protein
VNHVIQPNAITATKAVTARTAMIRFIGRR